MAETKPTIGATTPDDAPDDMSAVGMSGLRQYGGWVDEEFHPRLRGRRGVQTYREMADNDAIIGAILYTIRSHIQQVEWWVEPADEKNPKAKAEAEFVESCMMDMSHTWEDLIDEILSMLPYGWSYFETIYKMRKGESEDGKFRSAYSDGRFGWRKIELRGQDTLDRWQFDPDGGLRGMWQSADSTTGLLYPAFIPIEKALLFRPTSHKNNPEGKSIIRNAVRAWFMVKRIEEIEAIGIERDLAGLPVFEVPVEILSKNAGPKEQEIRRMLETLVQQIRRDEREGMLVPTSERTNSEGQIVKTGYKFSLVTSGGRRQLDPSTSIGRHQKTILQSTLMQFIELGMNDTGSRSLASSHTNTFAVALGAMLGKVRAVFNRFAIPRLMKLNSVPRELWPTMATGDIESPPLDEIGKYVTDLANAGFVLSNNKPLERKLLGYAKLPPPEETDEDGEIPEPPAPEE